MSYIHVSLLFHKTSINTEKIRFNKKLIIRTERHSYSFIFRCYIITTENMFLMFLFSFFLNFISSVNRIQFQLNKIKCTIKCNNVVNEVIPNLDFIIIIYILNVSNNNIYAYKAKSLFDHPWNTWHGICSKKNVF